MSTAMNACAIILHVTALGSDLALGDHDAIILTITPPICDLPPFAVQAHLTALWHNRHRQSDHSADCLIEGLGEKQKGPIALYTG